MINVLLLKKNAPRWMVLTIDMMVVTLSITLAFILRSNSFSTQEYWRNLNLAIPLVVAVRFVSFLIARPYAGIVRYTSTRDAGRIFMVISVGSLLIFSLNAILRMRDFEYTISYAVIVIDFLVTIFLMTGSRFAFKTLYQYISNISKTQSTVIIYGADDYGFTTKKVLEREMGTRYKVVAYVDKSADNAAKKLDGITVFPLQDLESILEKGEVNTMIIAQNNIKPGLKNELIDTCLKFGVKALTTPAVDDWINGELSFKQIRNINIEDLLERDPIKLDEDVIRNETKNQVILVTGAAGSIGSEIVKQLTKYSPKKIIVFDQAESPLYDLELELKEQYNFFDFEIVIGDITNPIRVNRIFELYRPNTVYHAAAYKHVPMMENNPYEAIKTNVLGTKNIADHAVRFKTNKFVMVSTDKAVNPTNVMGASKRIAEIYTQSLNASKTTRFITTRFGNVLGSNGSVIPRFKAQIEKGGPVTVTHPDVTRFFMTIPEACQLVLEAGAMGTGGEIFIFDMGKSVKISDLAKRMIQLSGLTVGRDIHLNYTGLRPGEKLYEELLADKENTMPTHHPQIMIAKVREYEAKTVQENITTLLTMMKNHDNIEIVAQMKRLVPEFKSQNSVYEMLDNEDTLNHKLKQGTKGIDIKNSPVKRLDERKPHIESDNRVNGGKIIIN